MKAPWHLWLIGVVSLLWNAVGAADYTMTQLRYEPYMSQFTTEQLDYFYGFPAWVVGAWAVAVWSAVAGSVLLLARKAAALWAFVVSLAGMVVTALHNYLLAEVTMTEIVGPGALAMSALILLVGLFLVVYARRMKIAGVLD